MHRPRPSGGAAAGDDGRGSNALTRISKGPAPYFLASYWPSAVSQVAIRCSKCSEWGSFSSWPRRGIDTSRNVVNLCVAFRSSTKTTVLKVAEHGREDGCFLYDRGAQVVGRSAGAPRARCLPGIVSSGVSSLNSERVAIVNGQRAHYRAQELCRSRAVAWLPCPGQSSTERYDDRAESITMV